MKYVQRNALAGKRFASWEALTPLGSRPPYQWAPIRRRIVAADALVSVAGSRYSVPARLVGRTVQVHKSVTGFAIEHADTIVAEHVRRPRHYVVMDPAHYAGLLRVDRTPSAAKPPQYDPRYQHARHGRAT